MEEQVKMLQNLGLQEYQAKAFSALLARSEATAIDIAEISGVPLTKLYAVLKSLEDLGFLKSSLSRPKIYRPIDVNNVVEMMIAKKQDKINEIVKKKDEITLSLNDLYNHGKKYETPKNLVWFLPNLEAGIYEISRLMSSAKNSFYSIGKTNDYRIAHTNHILSNAWGEATLTKGINSKIIKPPISFNDLRLFYTPLLNSLRKRKNKRKINFVTKPNIEVRTLPEEKINFFMMIKDDDAMSMGLKGLSSKNSYCGLLIYDKNVVNGMIDYFLSLWEVAKPEKEIYKNTLIFIIKRLMTFS